MQRERIVDFLWLFNINYVVDAACLLWKDSFGTSQRTLYTHVTNWFYTKQQKCIYIVDSDIYLHIIDIFQPKGIRVLGQLRNYTQYKLFCALTTVLKRTAHCCISLVKMVTQIRYNITLYVHFLSRSILSCPFFSWILIFYYFLLLLFIPFFSYNLRRMKSIR